MAPSGRPDAGHVIDYTQEDFAESEERYAVILDNMGSRSLSDTRRALTPTETLLANGAPVGGWFGGLKESIAAFASTVFVSQEGRPLVAMSNPEDLATIKESVESGTLAPVVDRTYLLSQTPDAVAHIGNGHAPGKTIITVDHATA